MENVVNPQYSHTHAHVPTWIMLAPIQPGASILYAILQMSSSAENDGYLFGDCSPSRKFLADTTGVNVKTITRWSKELEALGAIKVRKVITTDGTANVYTPQMTPPTGYAGCMSLGDLHEGRV